MIDLGVVTALGAVLVSIIGIGLSIYKSRPESQGLRADAAESSLQAVERYASENERLFVKLKEARDELGTVHDQIATMQTQIAELQSAVTRLEAQLVSLGIEPVTRKTQPRSKE